MHDDRACEALGSDQDDDDYDDDCDEVALARKVARARNTSEEEDCSSDDDDKEYVPDAEDLAAEEEDKKDDGELALDEVSENIFDLEAGDKTEAFVAEVGITKEEFHAFVRGAVALRNLDALETVGNVTNESRLITLCGKMGLDTTGVEGEPLSEALAPLHEATQFFNPHKARITELVVFAPHGGAVSKMLLAPVASMAVVMTAHAITGARSELARQQRQLTAAEGVFSIIFGVPELRDAVGHGSTIDTFLAEMRPRVAAWVQTIQGLDSTAFVRRIMLNVAQLGAREIIRHVIGDAERISRPIDTTWFDNVYEKLESRKARAAKRLIIRLEVRTLANPQHPAYADSLGSKMGGLDLLNNKLRTLGNGPFYTTEPTLDHPYCPAGVLAMAQESIPIVTEDAEDPKGLKPPQFAAKVARALAHLTNADKMRKVLDHANFRELSPLTHGRSYTGSQFPLRDETNKRVAKTASGGITDLRLDAPADQWAVLGKVNGQQRQAKAFVLSNAVVERLVAMPRRTMGGVFTVVLAPRTMIGENHIAEMFVPLPS